MAAGSIVVDLLMRTGSFETDTKRAEATAKKRADAIGKAFEDMGHKIGIAAGAAATALTAMVVSTANTAKEITNLAQLSGAGTQEFQRFAAAAKSVGVQQDQLGDMFKDFREKIGEFVSTGGGEMKDFFEQVAPKVGITADAFRNLSGPQALQLFYDSLQKAGLSTEQMSFYLESAANDTTKLIPLLRDGGKELKTLGDEAERTGRVMNDDAIKSAAEFAKNMDELGSTLTGIKNLIALEFIPTLNHFSGKFLTVAKDVGVAQAALITFGEAVAMSLGIDELAKLNKEAKVAQLNVQSLGRQLETAQGLPSWFGGDEATISTIRGRLDAEMKRAAQIAEQIKSLAGTGKPPALVGLQGPMGSPDALTRGRSAADDSDGGGGSGGGGGGKPSAEKVTEAQRLLESMQRQLQTALKLTELEKLQADIQAKKIEGLTPAIQAQLIGLAKQIDLAKALDEFDKATLDYLKEREEFEQSIVALRKELMTDEERNADALKTQLELIGKIADAKDRGDLTRRAIGKATAEAPEFAGLAPEVGGALGELKKIDEAEAKLQEWYDKQLEMLRSFREQRADLNAEFDAEEEALKAEHQAKLLQIETARSMAQLSAAESLFGNLADMTKNFAGEQSGIYRAMFAVQKAIAIAQSIVAIQQGIAMAAANPWPMNLAAMASVAAATASIISNITSTNVAGARATGGPVSADQTYLVGERGPELFVPNTNGAIVPNNKLGGGNVTVNLIEDKSRAGKTESSMNNGAQELDVFVADIMGDGPRSKAIRQAFGLQRRGY